MAYRTKYTLYGAVFGLCFPLIATFLSAGLSFGNFSLESLSQSQLQNPLLWMIDTAPFFLGLFAYLGGMQYDRLLDSQRDKQYLYDLLEKQNKELEEKVLQRTIQLEENIKQLIAANQIRNEIIATVSHELRTPLTAINGAIKIIKSGTVGDINNQTMELIQLADRNTVLLNDLINNILDIEKIQAGEIQLDMTLHSVSELVKLAINMNQSYAESFHIEMQFKDDGSTKKFAIDKKYFMQIMKILLSNACKFSPDESTIVIYLTEQDDNIRINIADHGIGIPAEFKDRVFEKFTQVDSSSTRAQGGTGLGLNIAKSLVESMQGKIGFYPNQDRGTVFFVDFPVVS